MNIDLDTITQALQQDPLTITIGGIDYRVKEFSVVDVLGLDSLSGKSDAATAEKMQTFFEGAAPPVLQDLVDAHAQQKHLLTIAGEKFPVATKAVALGNAAEVIRSIQGGPDAADLVVSLGHSVHKLQRLTEVCVMITNAISAYYGEVYGMGKRMARAASLISEQANDPSPA